MAPVLALSHRRRDGELAAAQKDRKERSTGKGKQDCGAYTASLSKDAHSGLEAATFTVFGLLILAENPMPTHILRESAERRIGAKDLSVRGF
ncbi:MAG: hypothetical protein WCA11_08870 [Terracidiphilus sp.]